MSTEKFDPSNPAYKKVEDLPKEEQQNYVDVEGGFITAKATRLSERIESVFKKYSDSEIDTLSRDIEVTPYGLRVGRPLCVGDKFEENLDAVIKGTGSKRLIDLGSSDNIYDDHTKLYLADYGYEEYVGVDLSINDDDFSWEPDQKLLETYSRKKPDKPLHVKLVHGELLKMLHKMPDNYGHVSMTGIQSENIIRNYYQWGIALVSEIKRVVPEGGIFYTDDGFMHDVLATLSPTFWDVFVKARALFNLRGSSSDKEEIIEKKQQLESYKCDISKQNNNCLGEYELELPEIGFKVYFLPYGSYNPFVIINTSKSPLLPQERS